MEKVDWGSRRLQDPRPALRGPQSRLVPCTQSARNLHADSGLTTKPSHRQCRQRLLTTHAFTVGCAVMTLPESDAES